MTVLQEVESLLESLETTLPEVSEEASEEKVAAAANEMLDSSEKLVGTLVEPTETQIKKSVKTKTTGVIVIFILQNSEDSVYESQS